jgi:hypothetical protein
VSRMMMREELESSLMRRTTRTAARDAGCGALVNAIN